MLMKDEKKRGCNHKFDIQNLELIRPVNNHRKLDFYESYQIHRKDAIRLMNQDQGPLKSPLFEIILKNKLCSLNQNIATVVFSIDITH
jgi:hypothetical protein